MSKKVIEGIPKNECLTHQCTTMAHHAMQNQVNIFKGHFERVEIVRWSGMDDLPSPYPSMVAACSSSFKRALILFCFAMP